MGEVTFFKKDSGFVYIETGNITIVFGLRGKRIFEHRRYKPEARIYDASALKIPRGLYIQACRLAQQILSKKSKPKVIQGTLF